MTAHPHNSSRTDYDGFLARCRETSLAVSEHYSLAPLCSFRTGGTAQFFYAPPTEEHLCKILKISYEHHVPLTLLGSGSNVLAPDAPLPGLTITTTACKGIRIREDSATIMCGESVHHAAYYLANRHKSALEFLYGMPGTIAGAVFMNARCYGKEISEIFQHARGYTYEGKAWSYTYDAHDFSYKISPFQNRPWVIVECTLSLKAADEKTLWTTMLANESDRRSKGHYARPCAGSVFKNNRNYGSPTGELLDKLGFCGQRHGIAKVSERHANIIVNETAANAPHASRDVYVLSQKMKTMARSKLNVELEREIVLLGDASLWKEEEKELEGYR